MTITIDDYCFSVDVDKTAAYYQNNTLCDCAACRNYRQQIAGALPSAAEWLRQFGVDIARPEETAWLREEPFPDEEVVEEKQSQITQKQCFYEKIKAKLKKKK